MLHRLGLSSYDCLILGSDGVRLWDLQSGEESARPTGAGNRGATTALAWIRREDDPEDGLVYGTANGYLVCWKEIRRGESSVRLFQAQWENIDIWIGILRRGLLLPGCTGC